MEYKFSYIEFRRKELQGKASSKYKVYKTALDYVTIEAQTAYEAMQKSGVDAPLKLERVGLMKRSLFAEAELN